jgi:hypothetical protein
MPLMLTTCDLTFQSGDLAVLRQTFTAYRAPRGYMIATKMMFYLKTVVNRHLVFMRLTRQFHALMVDIVMANHDTHTTPAIIPEMTRLGIR